VEAAQERKRIHEFGSLSPEEKQLTREETAEIRNALIKKQSKKTSNAILVESPLQMLSV